MGGKDRIEKGRGGNCMGIESQEKVGRIVT